MRCTLGVVHANSHLPFQRYSDPISAAIAAVILQVRRQAPLWQDVEPRVRIDRVPHP